VDLPQIVGLPCVVCGKEINSIVGSRFCDACGNPVHSACLAKLNEVKEQNCPSCGGDPQSSVAKEVRNKKGIALTPAELAAKGPVPIRSVCPLCGSSSYTKRRPEGWIAFVSDRVCTVCYTRYTPPTPLWASIVFIIAGLALAGFFGLAWLLGL